MKIISIQNETDPRNPDIQITMSFMEAASISAANVTFLCAGDLERAEKLSNIISLISSQQEVLKVVSLLDIANKTIFNGDASANVEFQKLLLQIRQERNETLCKTTSPA